MNASHALSALAVLAGLLLAVSPAASQQDATSFGTASTATADEQATAARTARAEQLRRFRYGNLAEIELSGKKVMVSYADLATDSDDYRAFEALEAGEVSAWQSAKAIKLMAHVSLSFGDVAVPYGNHAPELPRRLQPVAQAHRGRLAPRSSTPRATSGAPSATPPRTWLKCLSSTRGPTNRPRN